MERREEISHLAINPCLVSPIAFLVTQRNSTFSVASALGGLTSGRMFAVANAIAAEASKIQKEFREGLRKEKASGSLAGCLGYGYRPGESQVRSSEEGKGEATSLGSRDRLL